MKEEKIITTKQFIEYTLQDGEYEHWLSNKNIQDVAHHVFGWSENSNVIFGVNGEDRLSDKLHKFSEDKHKVLVYILNKNNNHWVTLVAVCDNNGKYNIFYVNSLDGRIDDHKIGGGVINLENDEDDEIKVVKVVTSSEEKLSTLLQRELPGTRIHDLSFKQQKDVYNCGIFALENAKIIVDGIMVKKGVKAIFQNLKKFTQSHVIDKRIEFARELGKKLKKHREVIDFSAEGDDPDIKIILDGSYSSGYSNNKHSVQMVDAVNDDINGYITISEDDTDKDVNRSIFPETLLVPERLQPENSVETPATGQKIGIQSNNQQPSPQSEKRRNIVTASTLAIAGIAAGIAIAVHLEMLAVGIVVGVCCLVSAAIIYYCSSPSNSLKESSAEAVAATIGTP